MDQKQLLVGVHDIQASLTLAINDFPNIRQDYNYGYSHVLLRNIVIT